MSFVDLGQRQPLMQTPRASVAIQKNDTARAYYRLILSMSASLAAQIKVERGDRVSMLLGTFADSGLLCIRKVDAGGVTLTGQQHWPGLVCSQSLLRIGYKGHSVKAEAVKHWRVAEDGALLLQLPGEIVRALGPAIHGERAA
jgi:hypothetical protein